MLGNKMKCKKAQKLIYLNRPGELNSREEKLLKRHLEKCFKCQKHQIRIEKTETQYHEVMNLDLKPKNSEKLAENIINEIKKLKMPNSYTFHQYWFSRIVQKLTKPKVQIALASLILFIMTLFFTQGMVILNKIAALEKQMAFQSKDHQKFDRLFYKQEYIEKSLLSDILENDQLNIDQYTTEFILIDKKTLRKLLSAYKKSQMNNRLLNEIISKIASADNLKRAINESTTYDKIIVPLNQKEIERWINKL